MEEDIKMLIKRLIKEEFASLKEGDFVYPREYDRGKDLDIGTNLYKKFEQLLGQPPTKDFKSKVHSATMPIEMFITDGHKDKPTFKRMKIENIRLDDAHTPDLIGVFIKMDGIETFMILTTNGDDTIKFVKFESNTTNLNVFPTERGVISLYNIFKEISQLLGFKNFVWDKSFFRKMGEPKKRETGVNYKSRVDSRNTGNEIHSDLHENKK